MLRDAVVVGASLAGLRAAETLRNEGYTGRLTLVGAERHLPYDRPPLSKKVLAGAWEPDRIHLRHPEEYADLELDLRLGVRAERLDVAGHRVELSDGTSVGYDGLILATGSVPRGLGDGPALPGVHVLRTLDDSLALREAFAATPRRVVVIGAGFIGAEVAATARGRGLDVTLLEALPLPLVRGLGPELGAAIAGLHRAEGVDLRLGVGVDAIEGGGRVERLRLSDGSSIDADVVVVGIGVAPATDWLVDSGLELRNGVVCDATLAAGPPGVYAAGDLARWPNPVFAEEMRLEHWTNAAEQGAAVARNLLATAAGGDGEPYGSVPFFWSDQYAARLQLVGHVRGDEELVVVPGVQGDGRLLALFGAAGRLRAVFGMSVPKLVMPYRRMLAEGVSFADAVAHAEAQTA